MAPKRDQLFDILKQQVTSEERFMIIDDSLVGARMAQAHNIPVIMVGSNRKS